jgi:hypothetical protein
MLTQSSLSAFLTREPSYLSGYEPDVPPWTLGFYWVSLTTAHAVQPPHMTTKEPSYLNGLKPGSPPGVAFSYQSHGPASPPVSSEPSYPNGLSPGVLLGFHSISRWGPPEVSLMMDSAHCIVHQLYILCYCFIDSDTVLSECSHYCFSDTGDIFQVLRSP